MRYRAFDLTREIAKVRLKDFREVMEKRRMNKVFHPPIDFDSFQTPVVCVPEPLATTCDHKLRLWDRDNQFWRCALCKYIYGMEEL